MFYETVKNFKLHSANFIIAVMYFNNRIKSLQFIVCILNSRFINVDVGNPLHISVSLGLGETIINGTHFRSKAVNR